jgi:hypothetical protein
MSENPTIKLPQYVEAPASWNTKYLSAEGFVCQITLRADSGKELLEKAQAAITHLLQIGCSPCETLAFRPKSKWNGNNNGNGHHPESKPETNTSSNDSAEKSQNENAEQCPIHSVEMKRWEKNGRIWYSHKLDNGGWCNGKNK